MDSFLQEEETAHSHEQSEWPPRGHDLPECFCCHEGACELSEIQYILHSSPA